MKHDMMWCAFLYLSEHMWDDASTDPRGWYLGKSYTEENSTEVEAWDEYIKFLAEHKYNAVLIDCGDAIKYESHPEISAPNAWTKDFMKQKLDEMRALGITPYPKLNFSCGHMTWMKQYNRMVSSPAYYQFCADMIKEVCELFDYPEYFHIGFDEEVERKQLTYEKVVVRARDLWWHDLFYIAGECEKHGARPWMWADYMWERGNEELYLSRMSKSILQSNWFYQTFTEYPETHPKRYDFRIKSYELLNERGFDQVPTSSSYQCQCNSYQTVAFCKDKLDPALLKGFMTAAWSRTTMADQYFFKNDALRLYLGRKEFYPETLK